MLRENHRFTNARKGQPQNWYSFASGFSGITYGAVFIQNNKARTEVYIDVGDAVRNKEIFDRLFEVREKLQAELNVRLKWDRMDKKKASRISLQRDGSILLKETELDEILGWHESKLLEFRRVFSPVLKRILSQ